MGTSQTCPGSHRRIPRAKCETAPSAGARILYVMRMIRRVLRPLADQ